MTYWLGKDVNIYMTTEQGALSVSGNASTDGMSALTSGNGVKNNVGGPGNFWVIPHRTYGRASGSKVTDVTGIDYSPSTVDENLSFMGKNTNLTAEIKKSQVITITRKVSNALFDQVYNSARDGVYSTDGADASGSGAVFDGLTTSNNQNFGYRIYLQFASGASVPVDETLIIRNCCLTAHSKSLTPDGATEETIEFYSYTQPLLTLSDASGTAITATTEI